MRVPYRMYWVPYRMYWVPYWMYWVPYWMYWVSYRMYWPIPSEMQMEAIKNVKVEELFEFLCQCSSYNFFLFSGLWHYSESAVRGPWPLFLALEERTVDAKEGS